MITSHRLTNSVTINYKYVVSPNEYPVNKVACASTSQFVKPLLMICKSASTDSTKVGEPFYYNITVTNTSCYPLYVSIFDSLPKGVHYNKYSFTRDCEFLPDVSLSKWIDLGILPPNSCTSIYFEATLVYDLNIEKFSNIAYTCYSRELPKCKIFHCNIIESNECVIKIDKNKKCKC